MSGDYDFCAVCGKATYECAGHAPARQGDEMSDLGKWKRIIDEHMSTQPSPAVSRSGEKERELGNLVDRWDMMANDTKDYLRELEPAFCNSIERIAAAIREGD